MCYQLPKIMNISSIYFFPYPDMLAGKLSQNIRVSPTQVSKGFKSRPFTSWFFRQYYFLFCLWWHACLKLKDKDHYFNFAFFNEADVFNARRRQKRWVGGLFEWNIRQILKLKGFQNSHMCVTEALAIIKTNVEHVVVWIGKNPWRVFWKLLSYVQSKTAKFN